MAIDKTIILPWKLLCLTFLNWFVVPKGCIDILSKVGLKVHSVLYTIGVNLAIFDNTSLQSRVDAAPTGLGFVKQRFSTEIPSLRDSRGF